MFNFQELFVEYFVKEAHKRTILGKRKTIQKRDLDATIVENDEMVFLEGTLDQNNADKIESWNTTHPVLALMLGWKFKRAQLQLLADR